MTYARPSSQHGQHTAGGPPLLRCPPTTSLHAHFPLAHCSLHGLQQATPQPSRPSVSDHVLAACRRAPSVRAEHTPTTQSARMPFGFSRRPPASGRTTNPDAPLGSQQPGYRATPAAQAAGGACGSAPTQKELPLSPGRRSRKQFRSQPVQIRRRVPEVLVHNSCSTPIMVQGGAQGPAAPRSGSLAHCVGGVVRLPPGGGFDVHGTSNSPVADSDFVLLGLQASQGQPHLPDEDAWACIRAGPRPGKAANRRRRAGSSPLARHTMGPGTFADASSRHDHQPAVAVRADKVPLAGLPRSPSEPLSAIHLSRDYCFAAGSSLGSAHSNQVGGAAHLPCWGDAAPTQALPRGKVFEDVDLPAAVGSPVRLTDAVLQPVHLSTPQGHQASPLFLPASPSGSWSLASLADD